MPQEWSNWSGSLRFAPRCMEAPEDEQSLAALVKRAADEGRVVRPVGSGHSSTPILATDDILVSLDHFQGVLSYDTDACTAQVGAGTTLAAGGRQLAETAGLGLPNYGDVSSQTFAGALSTGTHGTGRRLKDLTDMLVGGRLVTGRGELYDFSADDPDFLRAVRVSLGTFGILTRLTLKLVPAYKLRRREYCTHADTCLEHLEELIEKNRNFDFYWYPRSDLVTLRLLNPPGGGQQVPYGRLSEDRTGAAHQIIPKHTGIPRKFDEMEYALPAEAGPACFAQVRRRMKDIHRRHVGWRTLYRTIAADDTYLSPAYGRETVTISLHQNAQLPFWDFFKDMEPIFRDHGGRPHWAKKHTLRAAELTPLYPMWEPFLETRRRMDPDGVFLNSYLHELLGVS